MEIFDNFKKQGEGVLFFSPDDEKAYKQGKPTKGFGSIRYAEGSVYSGGVYFDGQKYNKLGFGKQEFYLSPLINGVIYGTNLRRICFVGNFDYKQTDWICGNGVMYYADENFKPSHFVKGYFMGVFKVGKYEGDFDYSSLMPPYTKDMEIDFSERDFLFAQAEANAPKDADIMLVGDSYFECIFYRDFYGKDYSEFLKGKKVINLGLGGSTYYEWCHCKTRLQNYPEPKTIFINLGFNDLHGNKTEEIAKNRAEFVEYVKTLYKNARLVFFNVVHAPACPDKKELENEYNKGLLQYAASIGAKVIDISAEFENSKQDLFFSDRIHPGPIGYTIMERLINENA